MRVCIISCLYPPYSKGGAEAVAAEAAAEFAASGHEVVVITARPFAGLKSLLPEVNREGGIKVNRFFPLNFFFYGNIGKHGFLIRAFWHLLDLWNVHAYLAISKIIKKEHSDLVLTHNLKGFGLIIPSALLSLRRGHNLSYKWLHTLHDVQLVAPSGILKPGEENKLGYKIFSILTRAIFCSPDVVVSPSKWLLDFYSERGFFPKSEKRVIANPIVRVKNQESPHQNEFGTGQARIKNQGQFNFLYLGQLEEHKGVLFLIEAWRKLLTNSKLSTFNSQLLTLTIAGDGSLLEKVKKETADMPSVKVLGLVPKEKIGELFGEVAAVIVPSLVYENAPNVIIESLSSGVPVIGSRIGGIPEMIEDGVTGWLFEPGNVESLIAAMEKLITSPLSAINPQPRPNYVSEILNQ